MKVLVCCLTYGNRPLDIIHSNLERAGYPLNLRFINVEGIANALNDGIYEVEGYDAIAYLANDIVEPDNWLKKKVQALTNYPNAGIVASSLGYVENQIRSQHIISNWLISKSLIDRIGIFNESMFPYGPIDLDYCERANVAGFCTYYCVDCMAEHFTSENNNTEYGYNKQDMIAKYWKQHEEELLQYRNGTKDIRHGKP
jgi:GT2 family glycosyltransferase